MSRGGMRYGAGRPSYKVKAEHLLRVEIGRWHRGGYLHAGRSFTWSWHRGDEPTGNIGVLVHGADSLALQYMVGSDDQRRDGSQTIWLAYTACNYGKSRPWFVCPVCQRRAAVLYMRAGRFACRHCQRVAYSSQSGDTIDRMWRKQSKIEARLGAHWQRPKGMRQQTYRALIERLTDAEERRENAFKAIACSLLGLAR
jgi:transposase-like protein